MRWLYVVVDPRKPGHFSYAGIEESFRYEPFYVGVGNENRLVGHRLGKVVSQRDGRVRKSFRLRDIVESGAVPLVLPLRPISSKSEADYWERLYVTAIGRSDLGRGPLLNQTDGASGSNRQVPLFPEVEKWRFDAQMALDTVRPYQGIREKKDEKLPSGRSAAWHPIGELNPMFGSCRDKDTNPMAAYCYIYIQPNGETIFIPKGHMKARSRELGVNPETFRECALITEQQNYLHIITKGRAKGWAAFRFLSTGDNQKDEALYTQYCAEIGNQQPSLRKQEGSTTIPQGSRAL